MPQANYYTVDITIRVRNGHHPGPQEALADAIARLGLAEQDLSAIVHTSVTKRPDGVVNPVTGRAS